jgi:hypothetical protein
VEACDAFWKDGFLAPLAAVKAVVDRKARTRRPAPALHPPHRRLGRSIRARLLALLSTRTRVVNVPVSMLTCAKGCCAAVCARALRERESRLGGVGLICHGVRWRGEMPGFACPIRVHSSGMLFKWEFNGGKQLSPQQ